MLYGRITIAFTTAFMLQKRVPELPRRGRAAARWGCWSLSRRAVANMVLDALFIAVFRWGGLAGAALATGIGQCIGGVVPAVYILRQKDLPLRFAPFKFRGVSILHACAQTVLPEFMSNIPRRSSPCSITHAALHAAGRDGVPAYGVR